MMAMNQSMLPYLMQMMQGSGGNGMQPTQNNAPQIPVAQQRGSNIAPTPQMPQQQQKLPGGAVGAGAQGMQNLGNMYSMGNKGYNTFFGQPQQTPNAMSGSPGNNISGSAGNNVSGSMNNSMGSPQTGGFQPSSPGSTMGYDPSASSAQPSFFSQMKNNMGMSQPGFDQTGSQPNSGLSGPSSSGLQQPGSTPGAMTGVNGSQLGGSGAIFNGTAGEGSNPYGTAAEAGKAVVDASSTDTAAGASTDGYASQLYNWLYDLL